MYGLIESLSELLRIPSISGNEKECKRALDFLLEVGNDFGFKTGRAADGKVGYIEIGEGQETLGVLTQNGTMLSSLMSKIKLFLLKKSQPNQNQKIGRAHV